MQNNLTAKETAKLVIDNFEQHFGKKFDGYVIFNLTDTPYTMFSIRFTAYSYFNVLFNYDRGSFGCCIETGNYGIDLESSQQWFDKADFKKYCRDIQQEIEIRIPDKFLRYKGWK
ncbi:hypothetical protein [Listeria ilorinensis]|uniref:hypothetical protein n=1 Tax=Listeria ilorinensis TaxID=2867439 RepID=UPI001EF4E02B|nr:hypothetical protein [Listeria ilorinensis]